MTYTIQTPFETVTRKRIDAARFHAHRLAYDCLAARGLLASDYAWRIIRLARSFGRNGETSMELAINGDLPFSISVN